MADNGSMDEREAMQRWVATWKQAGPELEAISRREIEAADTLQVLALLEGAFNQAIRDVPPRPSSGLVEMQRLLANLPR